MVLHHKPKVRYILHLISRCIFSGETSWTLSQIIAIPALLQPTGLKRCVFIKFIFESMNLCGHTKSHGEKDCQKGEIRFLYNKMGRFSYQNVPGRSKDGGAQVQNNEPWFGNGKFHEGSNNMFCFINMGTFTFTLWFSPFIVPKCIINWSTMKETSPLPREKFRVLCLKIKISKAILFKKGKTKWFLNGRFRNN